MNFTTFGRERRRHHQVDGDPWRGLETLERLVLMSADGAFAVEGDQAPTQDALPSILASTVQTQVQDVQQNQLPDFSLEDLNPGSPTFGQNVGRGFYDGEVFLCYFTSAL